MMCLEKDLGKCFLCRGDDVHYIPEFGLICDEKDRFLPKVAGSSNNLYNNSIIDAFIEYSTDRIRNAGDGRMGYKQAGYRGR
jgi:hypothetical protein